MDPAASVPAGRRDFATELAFARAQDRADPLAGLRSRFALPRPDSPGAAGSAATLCYLCGHSLGLAPLAARVALEQEISDWERLGVRGHAHAHAPWIDYAEALAAPLARLAGAHSAEVVAMNSLSVNLHLLLASFYRPEGGRTVILLESGAFSSDQQIVASQIAWHGLDPAHELIALAPRPGESCLRSEDIEACIAQLGARLALVLWPGVQYLTGQYFDVPRLAAAAHAAGALFGLDLAHAIGNVPLALHEDGVDFAAWCSYKYLNAGPGAIGGAFVHERHLGREDLPRLKGWWGHERATRFQMPAQFAPATGAASWAISNPPIFSAAPLRAALPLFEEAGLPALRRKSLALGAYLETLLREQLGAELTLVTPPAPARGAQLSLRLREGAQRGRQAFAFLERHGVIGDWREPDLIRLSAVPLYNRYEDMVQATWTLRASLGMPSG
jgi:kynureninase